MKRLILIFVVIVVAWSFQHAKNESFAQTERSIDIKWDRSGNIDKIVESGHKKTWTVKLTNKGNSAVDVWFNLNAYAPSQIKTTKDKLSLEPGKPVDVKFDVTVAFSNDYHSFVSVSIETLKNTYISNFGISYFENIDWDACFAENGKKELTSVTDDLVSKEVLLRITNKSSQKLKMFIAQYGFFYLDTKTTIKINIGTVSVRIQNCPSIIVSCETNGSQTELKLFIKPTGLANKPLTTETMIKKQFEKKENTGFLNNGIRYFTLTSLGYATGEKSPEKKSFIIKMNGIDGKTKWIYRTNLDCTNANFKVIPFLDKLLLVDRANDKKTDALDYVNVSDGKLAKQIRLPGFVRSWCDIEDYNGKKPSGWIDDCEVSFLEFYFNDSGNGKFFDLGNVKFVANPKTIKNANRYEVLYNDRHDYTYEPKSFTLKRFVQNKILWQYKLEKPFGGNFGKVWYKQEANSVFVTVSNWLKGGGTPPDEIIRLDLKSGKMTWRKKFIYTSFACQDGKLFVANQQAGYLAVYEEYTGKLLASSKLESANIYNMAVSKSCLRYEKNECTGFDGTDMVCTLEASYIKFRLEKH